VPQVALFLQEEAASHASGRRWCPQHPKTGVPYPSVVPPRRSEANLAPVHLNTMQSLLNFSFPPSCESDPRVPETSPFFNTPNPSAHFGESRSSFWTLPFC
jgi:hypothetical protein